MAKTSRRCGSALRQCASARLGHLQNEVELAASEKTRLMMMVLFIQLRGWVNAAGLLLMLSAAGCATPPAPQVAAPPPGMPGSGSNGYGTPLRASMLPIST
jgi:hypothetical protein